MVGTLTDTGMMIGFEPKDDEEETAHFFIENNDTRVRCTPVSGFTLLDPNELPAMAAFMWHKLTGEECPRGIALGIAAGWLECLRCYEQGHSRLLH